MHNSQPRPISIDLGFSMWILSYLLIVHLLLLILLFQLNLGINFLFILVAVIIVSLIYYWRCELQRKRTNSVIGVDWSYDRGWRLRLQSGENLKSALSATSVVSRWLVVLHFKTAGSGRHRVAIAGDAIDRNQLRRLKVLLKMHNHFGV